MGKFEILALLGLVLCLQAKSEDVKHGDNCKGQNKFSGEGLAACAETCKTMGIRGNVEHLAEVYGVYSPAGVSNHRSKYQRGSYSLMYGCQENAQGGDSEAWMVTNNDRWTRTQLYAPWTAACPSDIQNSHWWYIIKGKRGKYTDSNSQTGVEVVCNPGSEADFLSSEFELGASPPSSTLPNSSPRHAVISTLHILVTAIAVKCFL